MIEKYEIWNDKFKELEGYLTYDTETDMYSIKLLEDYTGKHPDVIFWELSKKGIIDAPKGVTDRWVRGRVFPPNRQGLRGMLKEIGIPEYNLHDLLLYFEGRCQMDYSYIKRVN